MRKHKGYSITRLVSFFMLLLFLATVLLSFFYYSAFSKKSYSDNLDDFETHAQQRAAILSSELQLAQQQLTWLVSNIGSAAYWTTDNAYEQLLYRQTMRSSLYGVLHNSDIIDAAFLAQRSNSVVVASYMIPEMQFLQLLETYGPNTSVRPATPSLFDAEENGEATHLILSKGVDLYNMNAQLFQTVANIYIAVRLDRLLPAFEGKGIQSLCLKNDNTYRVYYAQGEGADALPGSLTLFAAGSQVVKIGGVSYMAFVEPVDYADFHLVYLVEERAMTEQMQGVLLIGTLLVLAVLAVTIAGILVISRLIHRPVRNIVGEMKRIQQGDYAHRLASSTAREMREISGGVNGVLNELDRRTTQMIETQENLYRQQFLYQESRMQAMQAQVNPHFLYNTLECVRSIAKSHHIPEIPKILSGMINIFRYSASNERMGTLESELNCCESYMQIMQIRFGGRFVFTIEAAPAIMHTSMPRMVLQPLVENAINHGLADCAKDGEIHIFCVREGGVVRISVYDNGRGMAPETLNTLRTQLEIGSTPEKKEGSIGLQNVHQRLLHQFGEEYGLMIESEEHAYARVTVRVPYISTKEGEQR